MLSNLVFLSSISWVFLSSKLCMGTYIVYLLHSGVIGERNVSNVRYWL